MFTGRTIRRLFSRNHIEKCNHVRSPKRWDRCQLTLDRLEDRSVPATITVTGTGDTVAAGDGTVTLREAIAAITAGSTADVDITNQNPGAFGTNDSINFSGLFTSPQTISVSGQLTIGKAVTLTGPGIGLLTIQNSKAGAADSRILNITAAGQVVTISGLAMKGGNVTGANTGGAILSAGADLRLTNVELSNNFAAGNTTIGAGGAIAITGSNSKLTLTNCMLSGNSGTGTGGAILVATTSTVTINGSTLTSNTSNNGGGVINILAAATSSALSIGTSTFTSNKGSTGGVMDLRGSTSVTVNKSSFSDNSASSTLGGGVFYTLSNPSFITDSDSTYTTNLTSGVGAVVSLGSLNSTFSSTGSLFNGNIASGSGGGAINTDSNPSTITLNRAQFIGNMATGASGRGGAIRTNSTTVTLNIDNSIFDGNAANGTSTASAGGAIAIGSGIASSITINGSTFSNNSANVSGGAIANDDSAPITVNNTTFSGNFAGGNATTGTQGGGAIFHSGGGALKINNSTLVYNTATGATGQGGGILRTSSGGLTTLISTIVARNNAVTGQDIRNSIASQAFLGGANLIGVADDGNVTFKSTSGANLTGTKALPLNPQVGPLADNGGPTLPHTFTHGLLPGSPAIGTGNQNGLATDQTGKARPPVGASIGSTEVTLKAPSATVSSLVNVTTAGGTSYNVTVVYSDDAGIDTTTLDQNDVLLSGPSFSSVAVSKSAPVIGGGGKTATVTYSFPVPGATWDITDNGSYTVSMQGNQVFDIDAPTANAVAAGAFGTFNVAIPFTYVVNDNTADIDDGDATNGFTTLREAINLSNNLNVGVADVITFAASMNGKTITLAGELPVTDPVVIQGNAGGGITIDGNNASRIFNFAITGGAISTPSSISNLTMTKGKPATLAGGAIKLDANTLTLSSVTITASVGATNSGAVAVTSGNLTVVDSTFSGNSGGTAGALSVGSGGQITIIRTNISGNTATGTAGTGGGISIGLGSATIIDSAITDNVANGNSTSSGGGGIFMSSAGVLNITNSTIARNLVPNGVGQGGGILLATSANVTINNATIANNIAAGVGGGVAGNATSTGVSPVVMDVRSTIIAYNAAASAPDVYSKSTNPAVFNATIGDSIIGVDGGTMVYTSTNNQTNIDPLLSPLGFYGGSTKSIGLLPGSPAIDNGSNSLGLINDQRGTGFPRAVNGKTDVGAFEGLVPTPTAVAILNPAVGGATTYTIDVIYSSTIGLDTTSFDKSDVFVTGPGYVGNATPTINPSINGAGTSVTVTYTFAAPGGTWGNEDNGVYTLTLQGNQVFDVNALAALSGSLGTFVADIGTTYVVDKVDGGGNPVDDDDGITTVGELTLREAIKLANVFASQDTITFASSYNGKTLILASEIGVAQAVALHGTAGAGIVLQGSGGRILNIAVTGANANIAISNLAFIGGNATGSLNGGAILNADESISLTNVSFIGNVAGGRGGAISSSTVGAVVNVVNSSFTNNQASTGGGALHFGAASSTLTIDKSTLDSNSNNNGVNYGGAIFAEGAAFTLTISDSTVTNNVTNANGGGAIAVTGGSTTVTTTSITINTSKFENNVTNGSLGGGAIYASPSLSTSLDMQINSSTFTMNSNSNLGGNAGAIYLSSNTINLSIDKSFFTNNTANSGSGGALYVSGAATANITNSKFTDNLAMTFGGAIDFVTTSMVTIDNSLISNNTTTGNSAEGGGIFISSGSLAVTNSGIVNNAAVSTSSTGGSGGAISSTTASITILNSTLSGNYAFSADTSNITGGGALAMRGLSGGPLTIRNSTITNNTATFTAGGAKVRGGGILVSRTSPSVTIESSIVAGNNNPNNETDIYIVQVGSPIDGDNNIIGVADALNLTGANNKTGTLAAPFNPGLFPLSFNGGIAPTHPLWYNSPALNAGLNSLGLANDQRGTGFPREVPSGQPDIGAFEGFLDVAPFIRATSGIVNVTSSGGTSYEFTVTYDAFKGVDSTTVNTGDVTLTLPGGTMVTPNLVNKTVNGNAVTGTYSFVPPGGTWDATDNGDYTLTLNANEVFDLDTTPKSVPAQALGTFNVSITGAFVVDNDGDFDDGNYTAGNLTLREAIKLSNLNSGNVDAISFSLPAGTTISLNGTELSITDPVFITGPGFNKLAISGNNSSRIFNFAILGAGAETTISDLTLMNGMASTGGGGAINVDNDQLTLTNVHLTNNTAVAGTGGAISVGTTTLKIINGELTGNSASGDGGAIKSSATSGTSGIEITDSLFSGNQGAAGGAISMPTSTSSASLTVTNSKFIGNTASGNGGAISLTVGPATITGSILTANVSNSNFSGGGGGALSSNTSIVTIVDSEISDNQVTGANAGGGAWRFGGSSTNATIQNTTVSGNSVAGNGGAFIFNSSTSPTLNLFNSTIANNTAAGLGGAMYAVGTGTAQPTINLTSSIVAQNADTVTADIWSALDQATATVNLTVNAVDSILSLNTHAKIVVNASGTSLIGTAGSPVNAKLGALANNGGATRTHSLLAGSPAINAGSNPNGLPFDQRGPGFLRDVGQTDMGAFEVQGAGTPAKVSTVIINNGAEQRSRVTEIKVTFDQIVTFTGAPAAAFQLSRQSDNAMPLLTASVDNTGSGTVVTLAFPVSGTALNFSSLADGRYNLTIFANQVSNANGQLDGDGNGAGGDNYLLVGNTTNKLFRLFGDADGNGTINGQDFLAFRLAFLGSDATFDFDADGQVSGSDFLQFRLRFLQSV